MHQKFIIHSTSQPLIQYQPTNILATQVDFEVKDPSRMETWRNGTGRPRPNHLASTNTFLILLQENPNLVLT